MRKFLFFFVLFCLGCSKNHDGFIGTWNVKQASGTFAGIVNEYKKREVTWTFRSNNILSITNNYDGELNISPETGDYLYEVDHDTLRFDFGAGAFIMQFESDYQKLILDDNYFTSDGWRFILERN